jgi:hypothetical protein
MPIALPSDPSETQRIFTRAQTVWNARAKPPYETFTIACDETFLADRCAGDTQVQFIIRLADGRTYAHTLARDGSASRVLMRGGYVVGPAGAPFGFFRRTPTPGAPPQPAPPNLVADPIETIDTIATVSAVDRAYDITLAGIETLGARRCYHLRLRPLRDPVSYPLRDLWIDTASDDVVRLTYAQPFNATTAAVVYDFAPAGAQSFWSIVHIEASASVRALFSSHTDRVSEELHDIEFPPSEPAEYFDPEGDPRPAD